MRIGLIGKDNNKGLGTLSKAYQKYLPITKFADISEVTTSFVDDLDIVIMLEKPLDHITKAAKQKGVKSILKVNYEFLPLKYVKPDLHWCSSSLNYDETEGEKVLIPDPIDTSLIEQREVSVARTFVHNAGTIGLLGANGTEELLGAIPLVESEVKFIIRSQVPIDIKDERVDLRVGNVPYSELWNEGDVFITPQKFRATSLPIQEAMAAGMPVMTTDMQPFNEFCQFLIKPRTKSIKALARPVDYYNPYPEDIAEAIDKIAGKDIEIEAEDARAKGKEFSWEFLREKYMNLLKSML